MSNEYFGISFRLDKIKPPITRSIINLSNIQFKNINNTPIEKKMELMLNLNLGIFIKSNYAKDYVLNIKECCDNLGYPGDGVYHIYQAKLLPIMGEVDSLLFELHSILECLAREIDIVWELGHGMNLDIFLPDNPDSDDYKYSIDEKVLLYPTCKNWPFTILYFVNDISYEIGSQLIGSFWDPEEHFRDIKIENVEY